MCTSEAIVRKVCLWGSPCVCDDGVTIARSVNLPDPEQNLGAGSGALGFNAARGEYVDLVRAGIIDPAKVVRSALENAVSVAGVLLLAEGTLTEIEEMPTEHVPGLPEMV